MMETLHLSEQMQERIFGMWCSMDDDHRAWPEIEEQAMAWLSRYHARKASVLQMPLLVSLLPKYMQPEQTLVDYAVLTAALNTLGRPAFRPTEFEVPMAPSSEAFEINLLAELDIASNCCPAMRSTDSGGPRVWEHGPSALFSETEMGQERLTFDRFNFVDFEESQDPEPMNCTSLDIWELEVPTVLRSDSTTRPLTRLRPLRKLTRKAVVSWPGTDAL